MYRYVQDGGPVHHVGGNTDVPAGRSRGVLTVLGGRSRGVLTVLGAEPRGKFSRFLHVKVLEIYTN